jgi:hypothetical protein
MDVDECFCFVMQIHGSLLKLVQQIEIFPQTIPNLQPYFFKHEASRKNILRIGRCFGQ